MGRNHTLANIVKAWATLNQQVQQLDPEQGAQIDQSQARNCLPQQDQEDVDSIQNQPPADVSESMAVEHGSAADYGVDSSDEDHDTFKSVAEMTKRPNQPALVTAATAAAAPRATTRVGRAAKQVDQAAVDEFSAEQVAVGEKENTEGADDLSSQVVEEIASRAEENEAEIAEVENVAAEAARVKGRGAEGVQRKADARDEHNERYSLEESRIPESVADSEALQLSPSASPSDTDTASIPDAD